MGRFILPKGQQMVQGFPVNRYYTKDEADAKFESLANGVSGPASSTNNNVAFFNGTTGKIIKDSGLALSGSNTGDQTKASLGLGNVDNTSDANKPVSTATQTALNLKLNIPSLQTYNISNVVATRIYDANSTSLNEIADALGTLIADLRTAGLLS